MTTKSEYIGDCGSNPHHNVLTLVPSISPSFSAKCRRFRLKFWMNFGNVHILYVQYNNDKMYKCYSLKSLGSFRITPPVFCPLPRGPLHRARQLCRRGSSIRFQFLLRYKISNSMSSIGMWFRIEACKLFWIRKKSFNILALLCCDNFSEISVCSACSVWASHSSSIIFPHCAEFEWCHHALHNLGPQLWTSISSNYLHYFLPSH